jgi:hypothetical protein
VRYSFVEEALLRFLPGALEAQAGIELPGDLDQAIINADESRVALKHKLRNILENMSHESSPALRSMRRELEDDLETAEIHHRQLTERRDAASGRVVGARIGRAVTALRPPEEVGFDRHEANLALRGLFRRAIINWPLGTVDLDWHVGGTCEVRYAMGGA